ncbi:putative carbonic anhydrase-like protein 1 isoform X2 [Cryptotermes secundus]|uniref:putative carbonic anhydrase-like protein 1 isoform X2 n=1 Tax=Cryptotermes secundus TaxID=105785 RepID=UPI000CD7DD8B|nr:putative carbonic anhydrase-like protein 1 isoform X2 [Cryptotermes secundus]
MMSGSIQCLLYLLVTTLIVHEIRASWEEWWTYDGISGPAFWGLINPQWPLCTKGRRQSPIDVDPEKLLYDPYLRPVHLDKHKIQLYGFNAELYHNMSEAQHKSQGIVGISLMVQIGDTPNPELRIITSTFNQIQYKAQYTPIRHLSLHSLLPETLQYMTYEGSTTHPGCWETTVWIILNRPIYITKQEFYALRKLMQGSETTPKAPLGNNARPVQHLHHRTVRTNIDFKKIEGKNCPSMKKKTYYKANTWIDEREPSYQV